MAREPHIATIGGCLIGSFEGDMVTLSIKPRWWHRFARRLRLRSARGLDRTATYDIKARRELRQTGKGQF